MDEPSTDCEILFSNFTKERKRNEDSLDGISDPKLTRVDSFANMNNHGAPASLNENEMSENPPITQFNEAVIIDVTQFEDKHILTFLDAYSSFALSTTIEQVKESELLNHIKSFWNDIFSTPNTFICGNSKTISDLLLNLEVPILFFDSSWVGDHLRNYYNKFEDSLFKIRKDVNCSISQAVLWASSIANSTCSGAEIITPALHAFEFIPLLPCVKEYKPPQFNTKKQYDKVVNNYFAALTLCYRRNKKRQSKNWPFLHPKMLTKASYLC